MKFVILIKATKDTEAGVLPTEDLLQAQLDYNESLMAAGVWVDGNGFRPTRDGWRVHYEPGGVRVEEGPFDEEGLIAGLPDHGGRLARGGHGVVHAPAQAGLPT